MSGSRVFLICVFIGVLGGVIYDVFFLPRDLCRKKWLRFVCDFLFCLCFGAFYLFSAVCLGLPSIRFFHLLGLLLGLFLYLKSFHKIIAFLSGKLYNKTNSRVRKRKPRHGRGSQRGKTS